MTRRRFLVASSAVFLGQYLAVAHAGRTGGGSRASAAQDGHGQSRSSQIPAGVLGFFEAYGSLASVVHLPARDRLSGSLRPEPAGRCLPECHMLLAVADLNRMRDHLTPRGGLPFERVQVQGNTLSFAYEGTHYRVTHECRI